MRLAYINNIWDNHYGHYLMEILKQRYNELTIDIYFCASSESNRKYQFESSASTLYGMYHLKGEISWGIDKHFNWGIFPLIFQNKYDLYFIGGYFYPTVMLAIILCRLLKRRYILVIDHMYKKKGFLNIIKKFLITGANGYITTSLEAKENLIFYGARKNNIYIAPLSCNDSFYRTDQDIIPDVRFLQKYNLKEKYILFVGRFEEYKGVTYLLEAFKLLKFKYKHNDIDLVLIGSGALQENINNFIEINNLKNDIKVISWLSYTDLPIWYKNALIFVFPSYYDVWAFVINEAMAARLPVISTNEVGAVRALIKNDINGIVIPSKNSEILAHEIDRLLQDIQLREILAKNAFETALKYKLDNIAKIYIQAIQNIIK